jgi:hypothetical protein
LVFSVLPSISKKWHHGGDPLGTGTAGGVHHDQQFHDVVIGGWAAGLDDEDICPADVFVDFYFSFAIRKC